MIPGPAVPRTLTRVFLYLSASWSAILVLAYAIMQSSCHLANVCCADRGQPPWDLSMKEDRASVDGLFARGPTLESDFFGR